MTNVEQVSPPPASNKESHRRLLEQLNQLEAAIDELLAALKTPPALPVEQFDGATMRRAA